MYKNEYSTTSLGRVHLTILNLNRPKCYVVVQQPST